MQSESILSLDQNDSCGYIKNNCLTTSSSSVHAAFTWLEDKCSEKSLLLLIKKVGALLLQPQKSEDIYKARLEIHLADL